MSETPEFQFALPDRYEGVSDLAHAALQLAAIAGTLALEERQLVSYVFGKPENVAEHSAMLAIVAPAIAEQFYPDLDANLIARYATVHDAVEAYVGDTPTHSISSEGMRAKKLRESEGLAQLLAEFAWLPSFAKLVDSYEAQVVAEARFVRVLDKWMPLLAHFVEGGETLRSYITPSGLRDNAAEKAADLKQEYPEFADLIAVRTELSELAIKHLFKP